MLTLKQFEKLKEGEFKFGSESLSQLLAEIEARGWNWTIRKLNTYISTPEYTYRLVLLDKNESTWGIKNRQFMSNTPEDACADALLWIIKQGRNTKK